MDNQELDIKSIQEQFDKVKANTQKLISEREQLVTNINILLEVINNLESPNYPIAELSTMLETIGDADTIASKTGVTPGRALDWLNNYYIPTYDQMQRILEVYESIKESKEHE